MLIGCKKGDTVYTTAKGLDQAIKKVTLIERYTNINEACGVAGIWVVKYTLNGGTYYNMCYEEYLTTASEEYDKYSKKQAIKDQMAKLEQELRKL